METLKAEKRTVFGKQLKRVRETGSMPVVAYGKKGLLGSYAVSTSAFKKVFKHAGESSVIALETPDGEKDILIHEVDFHPVSGEPVHADFYVIEKGQKVQVKIPLTFEGVSPAVKSLGGILMKVLHELEIEAEPRNLPHVITVDISTLATFEDKIHARDIAIPSGVRLLENADEVVALVQAPVEEKEEVATPIDLSAIEVAKKGKKEEEGAPEEAAAA